LQKKLKYQNFTIICSVEAELLTDRHTDKMTDRREESNSRSSQFC